MYLLFCSTKERSHGIDGPALVGVQCGSGRRIFVFLGVGMAMLHPELFFLLHSLGPCPPGPSSPIVLTQFSPAVITKGWARSEDFSHRC